MATRDVAVQRQDNRQANLHAGALLLGSVKHKRMHLLHAPGSAINERLIALASALGASIAVLTEQRATRLIIRMAENICPPSAAKGTARQESDGESNAATFASNDVLSAGQSACRYTQTPTQWPKTHCPRHAMGQPQSLGATPLLSILDVVDCRLTGDDCFGSVMWVAPVERGLQTPLQPVGGSGGYASRSAHRVVASDVAHNVRWKGQRAAGSMTNRTRGLA
jgi:hypothetical protein